MFLECFQAVVFLDGHGSVLLLPVLVLGLLSEDDHDEALLGSKHCLWLLVRVESRKVDSELLGLFLDRPFNFFLFDSGCLLLKIVV